MPLGNVTVAKTTRRTRHPGGVLVGAVASLALHALLLAPILFGSGAREHHKREDLGASASAGPGSSDAMIVELIQEWAVSRDAAGSALTYPSAPVLGSATLPIDVPVPQLPISQSAEETSSDSAAAPGDGSQYTMLYGRYVGQISARIERAWMKPRTPIGEDMFSCRLEISQDRTGAVLEVTLIRCNGDAKWKTSLVSAVRSASPLPAPPDSKVFTPKVMLDFLSAAYGNGASPEGFEPPPALTLADANRRPNGTSPAVDPPSSNPNSLAERLHVLKGGTLPEFQNR